MPHISHNSLPQKDLIKLYTNFTKAIEHSKSRSATILFLEEFLTRTEKIMLAKRFAVIYLLSKNVPVSYISESLRMSPATVHRMSLEKEIGKYKFLLSISKELDGTIWDVLEVILRAGLPPIAGRGRWKHLYD